MRRFFNSTGSLETLQIRGSRNTCYVLLVLLATIIGLASYFCAYQWIVQRFQMPASHLKDEALTPFLEKRYRIIIGIDKDWTVENVSNMIDTLLSASICGMLHLDLQFSLDVGDPEILSYLHDLKWPSGRIIKMQRKKPIGLDLLMLKSFPLGPPCDVAILIDDMDPIALEWLDLLPDSPSDNVFFARENDLSQAYAIVPNPLFWSDFKGNRTAIRPGYTWKQYKFQHLRY